MKGQLACECYSRVVNRCSTMRRADDFPLRMPDKPHVNHSITSCTHFTSDVTSCITTVLREPFQVLYNTYVPITHFPRAGQSKYDQNAKSDISYSTSHMYNSPHTFSTTSTILTASEYARHRHGKHTQS